jgi:hypothetical protein
MTKLSEQPSGTKRIAQVMQSFAYDGKWITSDTPRDEVNAIPNDVLEEHEKTGFVLFVDTPDTPKAE